MAIFRENDDIIKASRDEMPIFLRFPKLLRTTYLFAKFCDLTHFQSDFKQGGLRGKITLGENWDQSTLAGIGLRWSTCHHKSQMCFIYLLLPIFSSNHKRFFKKIFLENFAKPTGKHLCLSLLSNKPAFVLKKRL